MSVKAAVGIDLGTTYSCVAVVQNGKVEVVANDLGFRTTPSCVAFTESERLIGNAAKNQIANNPINTIFDVKRMIGRQYYDETIQEDIQSWPYKVSKVDNKVKINAEYKGELRLYSPEEISAMVLTKMKETAEIFLNEKVTDVVITVPAYFTEVQRQATKVAGEIAGLNVLRLISEPTAVALAYGVDKLIIGKKTVLIFDFGGGTLDVSIVTIRDGEDFEVKATAGDTHLGGSDFDKKMKEYFIEAFKDRYDKDISGNPRSVRRLLTACEDAKVVLSAKMETTVYVDALYKGKDFSTTFSRAAFEELCDDLLSSIIKPVEEALSIAHLNKNQIDHVILAGGSTRIPKVQKLLKDFFNGKELNKSINPDEAIAYGAAIQAALLTGNMGSFMKDIKLVDVTPLTLGIRVLGEILSPIIKRCSPIPTQHTETYVTIEDFQQEVAVSIYQGERPMIKDLTYLGHIMLTGIPPALRGEEKIEVTFSIDVDGILSVVVYQPTTGKSMDLVIQNVNGRLSKPEILKMIEDATKFKEDDKLMKEKAHVRNSLEEFVYKVKRCANATGEELAKEDKITVLEACSSIKEWMENNSQVEVDEVKTKHEELEELASSILLNLHRMTLTSKLTFN
ncbi:heat shock protein 68-like isoform X2 [Biomphalaria glabrata]|uniref:Heat shock protein 68-like isoform X2 n=1 Tax=Biomphalaria glabrata TaxID=6526 RepID=A0A9W2ZEW2_BIOGL|nr:heat shock protein 68-like isoform X2 [Biomphalaria glabrata]XP_055873441.1 heat shock protein 68-like isoform X2 [Biomphalaria glabrata]